MNDQIPGGRGTGSGRRSSRLQGTGKTVLVDVPADEDELCQAVLSGLPGTIEVTLQTLADGLHHLTHGLARQRGESLDADKTRHVADALGRQRLDRPYVRGGDGKLKSATWDEAFDAIKSKLDGVAGAEIGAIAGDLQGVEGLYSAKQLLRSLDSPNTDCRQSGAKLGGARGSYLFNTTIAGIEDADAILLVGTNPRKEATVLNARIRKAWLAHKLEIMRIGEPEDLTYEVMELGNNPADLAAIAEGRHDALKVLKDAERPMIIIGESALARPDGAAILHACAKVAEAGGVVKEGWNGFNVLHAAAARVGGLDIGFLPADGGKDVGEMLKPGALKVLFLLGADEVNASASDAFKVYLGSHGDRGAHVADVILPAAAYTEQDALYVNTEGRVQAAMRAAFPPGDAKADWAIFRALSAVLSKTLPFDTLEACRAQLFSEYEHLAVLDEVPSEAVDLNATGQAGTIDTAPFSSSIADYYLTNSIARASSVMAECSAMFGAPQAVAAE